MMTIPPISTETGVEQHLAFIGKILSLYTHEQKNHLAIINESAGLIGDMIEFSETLAALPEASQLLDIIKSIAAQIKKSSDMAKYLNAFGHRMDMPLSSFNVNDCIEEVVVLLHRHTSQYSITLKTDYATGLTPITGNPASLQLLVFTAVQGLINAVREKSNILIKTFNTKDAAIISISPVDAAVSLTGDLIENYDYFKPAQAVTINGSEINILIPQTLVTP